MKTTLHTVLPPASDIKFIGEEPTWTEVAAEKYGSELSRGLNWHNYCTNDKSHRKFLEEWMKEHRPKTAKDDIVLWRKVPDSKVDKTICKMARMHLQGFPMNDTHLAMVEDYVVQVTKKERKSKKTEEVAAPVKQMPTIQDRMRQQVSGVLSNLDFAIDEAFDGRLPDVEAVKGDLLSQGFKAPQFQLISNYLVNNIMEWQVAYGNNDEQLVEGYKYVPRKHFKKIIDSFNDILSVVMQHQTKLKAQRIVRKKPMDKKKMANKIKFLAEDKELGIKSVDPVNIIGANVLWVYDVKKRSLGYYEGVSSNSLFIRGTMIDGFKTTCAKTLRKPKEQLDAFMKLRKNQTINWVDDIKAKCKTLNGRMSAGIIILRID